MSTPPLGPVNDNAPAPKLHPGQVWRHVSADELAIIREVEDDFERSVSYFVLNGGRKVRQRSAPVSQFFDAYDTCVSDLRHLLGGA